MEPTIPGRPLLALQSTPKSWNMAILQPQSMARRKFSIHHPTSMFQLFGVYCTPPLLGSPAPAPRRARRGRLHEGFRFLGLGGRREDRLVLRLAGATQSLATQSLATPSFQKLLKKVWSLVSYGYRYSHGY